MTDFTIAQLPRRKLARHPNSLLPIEQNQSVGLQFYLVGYGTKTRKFFPIIRRCRRSCRATYRKLHLIVLTHKINHIGDSTGTSISERWIPRPSVEINRTHGIVERQWSHIIPPCSSVPHKGDNCRRICRHGHCRRSFQGRENISPFTSGHIDETSLHTAFDCRAESRRFGDNTHERRRSRMIRIVPRTTGRIPYPNGLSFPIDKKLSRQTALGICREKRCQPIIKSQAPVLPSQMIVYSRSHRLFLFFNCEKIKFNRSAACSIRAGEETSSSESPYGSFLK